MNWIDYIICGVLVIAVISGLNSGPIFQFLRICSILLSFLVAFFFYDIPANILGKFISPDTLATLSYFLLFGLTFIITYIFTDVIRRFTGKWTPGVGLRLLGGLLGILKGFIFCGAIIFGIMVLNVKPADNRINSSWLAYYIGKGMQATVSMIPEDFSNKIKKYKETMEAKMSNDDT